MYEIIHKKKMGMELSASEIEFAVNGFTSRTIPDFQMSALLMAICLNGMTAQETTNLTMAMVATGETIDTSVLGAPTFDKHSTGGVGDKATFIVAPILAALGQKIPKMSGRGLGYTGGTIDKLEAIPGLRTSIPSHEIMQIVSRHGLCIAGQTANLAPADKAIYALRDATATVESIPLIAASVMSKKIATGAKYIMLDVKCGSGAFMKDMEQAQALANAMVDIGNACGRVTSAIVTDMSQPLGYAIGNSLELIEAINMLSGNSAPKDLYDICTKLCVGMLSMSGYGTPDACAQAVHSVISNGAALQKFANMVKAQGGDPAYIYDTSLFETARHTYVVRAANSGTVTSFDTMAIGLTAMSLGAGRATNVGEICHSAGLCMHIKKGHRISAGDPIATLHTGRLELITVAAQKLLDAVTIE